MKHRLSNVLVVDNDSMYLSFLNDFLCKQGYRVVEAADGQEALHIIDQNRPDLIITDLVMPNIGGERLIEEIRKTPEYRR
jgi:twitching motility two-component system response regulator PilH